MTRATRRVARRLAGEQSSESDNEAASVLLAAMALAVDRKHPAYLSMLVPRPPAALGRRLVEMLRVELLTSWADPARTSPPSVILNALTALEQVRQGLDRDQDEAQAPEISAADPLNLFVEVAHDLNSPLTSILCLTDTLRQDRSGPTNDLQHRQLGLIYGAALGLRDLVNNALELARGPEHLVDDTPDPLSLSELMEEVASIVRPMAEDKGLRVDFHTIQPDRRLGHRVALARVLLNLTTNALKFTHEGSVVISCAPRGGSRVEFAVRDTGPGINPDAVASLYHMFRRMPGGVRYRFSSTGLGLAICRQLVGAMGSELQFESSRWGTRFYFELDLPLLEYR